MKNKGILISMAAVLVIGILITKSTHNFIEKDSSGSGMAAAQVVTEATGAAEDRAEGSEETGADIEEDMEPALAGGGAEAAPQEAALLMDEIPLEPQAGSALSSGMFPDPLGDPDLQNKSRSMPDMDGGDKSVYMETAAVPITPLDPPADAMDDEVAEAEVNMAKDTPDQESQSYYTKRLKDLDSQIEKSHDVQETANANNSARSTASNELKLWDSELNSIYNAILERLGKERAQELVEQQRRWLKERDSIAMEAAKNSSGGSSESLEYTVSLIESTRARAYELAEIYGAELE